MMVLDLWKIAKFFHVRVVRDLYRREDYTLREHFVSEYSQEGEKIIKIQVFSSTEDR